MSTIEINKIVGAILGALLLLLGLSFIVELVAGHHDIAQPAFVVPPPGAADVAEAPQPAEGAAADGEPAGSEAPEPPLALAEMIAAADPAEGEKAFRKCAACHSVAPDAKHKIGPNLWGVAGAAKAGKEDFRYSAALAAAGGVWDDAALDAFLADPRAAVPATRMAFPGLRDPAQRAAAIAYLRTLTDG